MSIIECEVRRIEQVWCVVLQIMFESLRNTCFHYFLFFVYKNKTDRL